MLKGIVVEAEAEEVRGVWCIIRLKGVWTESEIRERKVHQCQAKRSMIPLCPEGAQLSLSDTSWIVVVIYVYLLSMIPLAFNEWRYRY